MRWSAVACGVLVVASGVRADAGKEQARAAADRFGAALTSKDTKALRPILPTKGKIHLELDKLAEEQGSFGASQVEAVFRDALAQVSLRGFEVTSLESDGKTFAFAHARAEITDRQGRTGRLFFHLVFELGGNAWLIREIKETPE